MKDLSKEECENICGGKMNISLWDLLFSGIKIWA